MKNLKMPARHVALAVALASLLALGLLAGCSSSTTATKPAATNGPTAKGALNVALSAVSTMAPDAKLLVVQSADTLTATSTPVWEYLIGSPKTDKVYVVMVMGGKAQAQPYGTGGLSAAEWAAVPSIDQWKIDSDAAYQKALAVHAAGKQSPFLLGFVTYVPKSATKSGTQPMKWFVSFDPKYQGTAPTSTVDVDVTSGQAAYAK